MKAVIMAGGEGTRLRPLTANQPKPMLPLGNRPMMEHIVRHVHSHGFKDIVVTVQFLASQVRNYFGDGSDMGVDLTYATETAPLGTAGSVRNAAEQLQDTFLVISGDALTDVDLGELVAFRQRTRHKWRDAGVGAPGALDAGALDPDQRLGSNCRPDAAMSGPCGPRVLGAPAPTPGVARTCAEPPRRRRASRGTRIAETTFRLRSSSN